MKVRPSQLDEVYWSHTLQDLRTIVKLHVQQEMVRTQSFTESLAIVASQIFGGKSSKDSEREVEEVGTAEDAIRAAQGML